MKKMLIIGSDIHSQHYIDTIIFNDNIDLYILKKNGEFKSLKENGSYNQYYEEKDNLNYFDYIIYSEPLMFNETIFNKIKLYNGILLIEKLQTQMELIELLKCDVYIIHLRDFVSEKYSIDIKKSNDIIWPNLTYDGMDAIYNTLPNILDLINYLNIIKNDFEVIDYSFVNKSRFIKLISNNNIYNIQIYDTYNKDEMPYMNGIKLTWPNYFMCISKLIEELTHNRLDYEYSKNREKIYNNIINEMEEI